MSRYRTQVRPSIDQMFLDLRRRVGAVERTPQLGYSSVDRGQLIIPDADGNPVVVLGVGDDTRRGLQVIDADGNIQARVGQLASDTTPSGVEQNNTNDGSSVSFSALAYGLTYTEGNNSLTVSSTSYIDATDGYGPEAEVVIGNSLRALVIVTCAFSAPGAVTPYAYMSYKVDGPTSGTVLAGSDNRAVQMKVSIADNSYGAMSRVTFVDPIYFDDGPGTYRFTAQYRVSTDSAFFQSRSLLIMPF